jgi:hypothetical protein
MHKLIITERILLKKEKNMSMSIIGRRGMSLRASYNDVSHYYIVISCFLPKPKLIYIIFCIGSAPEHGSEYISLLGVNVLLILVSSSL